jgi:predicted anti-sigma-YlaC factor YlaD
VRRSGAGGDGPTRLGCRRARQLVSANLDGEASADECAFLADHLAGCDACRGYAADAAELHRAWSLRPAPDVPDLTNAILAIAAPHNGGARPRTRRLLHRALRLALAGLAAVQLALAAPALVDRTDTTNGLSHLNAWAVGFALGLLVAAIQPARARGLLPLAVALGSVMGLTVGLDVFHEHAIPMPAATHVIEIVGAIVLWALARVHTDLGPPSSFPRARPSLRAVEATSRNPDVA